MSEAKKTDVKTITLSFEAKDAALLAKIVKDAETDDRSPSKLLMIFLRKSYVVGE